MATNLGQESVRMGPWLKPPKVVALYLRVAVMAEQNGIGSKKG